MALSVSIITPEKAFDAVEADSVILPAFDGQVGIMNNHAPYLCQLGAGDLVLKRDKQADHHYALRGGVAQVAQNEVRILAESVVDVDCVTEEDLVRQLQDLDAAEYEDGISLAEAKTKAHWLVTQLKAKGKEAPELKQLG